MPQNRPISLLRSAHTRLVLNVAAWPPIQVICTGTSPSDDGKHQVNAPTVQPADLRERKYFDTCDVHLNKGCFRSSQTRSA